ncbi:Flavoprotein OS=Tsukamurella paurometabola (strain ATCC 8368 / DSM / CCUG 35730 / CIP 100753/ JCM 10117 / KCTC 9821 / NBRC 16120 / NCIMB 702349 / NCTC 13040) OX=521096 GN=Tpau_0038 PE=4 SV=1 [Tsukamurella paurometabola]|uniref:Flavoprotein n=1 Tax=Tsukamurella paurometabola (strain ATCC 8368 / DSM 20162 / CCUG 35730 / CIP 100753 / JCM 10117 / KCTC 9821 / NBRC 16120 / NCIMB 702349 / NCTC 13040) TaxID=521096 RepID=D5UPS4_TSUPD|nr:flavoprotein [Tsukamurella paurometabola]ADG76692.1 flavoprotein [Tsukamurella paurometabola DSM 20162]SUP41242.1 Uncharacterised protein [Tsukamurella paurometabola]
MSRPTLYLIGCASPPVLQMHEWVDRAQEAGWAACVILSEAAATWLTSDQLRHLEESTGHPVRSGPRSPFEPDPLPPAHAAVGVPVTFATLNKIATGVTDTIPVGKVCELAGSGLPVALVPRFHEANMTHPQLPLSMTALSTMGIRVAPTGDADDETFDREFDKALAWLRESL